jgi:hypothetical protein
LAKLDDAEIERNRSGGSNDARADAAVRFAAHVVARTDVDFPMVQARRAV